MHVLRYHLERSSSQGVTVCIACAWHPNWNSDLVIDILAPICKMHIYREMPHTASKDSMNGPVKIRNDHALAKYVAMYSAEIS